MPARLDENDWRNLLQRLRDRKCTPFVGAGACAGTLPLASEIASQWAESYNYPLADSTDLARISQFLAIEQDDDMFSKEEIKRQFESRMPAGLLCAQRAPWPARRSRSSNLHHDQLRQLYVPGSPESRPGSSTRAMSLESIYRAEHTVHFRLWILRHPGMSPRLSSPWTLGRPSVDGSYGGRLSGLPGPTLNKPVTAATQYTHSSG
jgi:hypothetical protein